MTRILADTLRSWSTQALVTTGVPTDDAAQIAGYLVDVDLRGIKTHGTRQLRRYVGEFQQQQVNPSPTQSVLRETDNSIRYDGDGGAGYLVATLACDRACEKAKEVGLAVGSTCHHGHVGSAGIYARRALTHGLISWGMAGGRNWRKPEAAEATVWDAMMSPPMCFGVPSAAGGPPLVLDMNANQFHPREQSDEALAAGFHRSVFGSLGMRFISTLLAGALCGTLEDDRQSTWEKATRGFLFIVLDPDLVGDAEAFRTTARSILDQSLSLKPMAGTDEAALPGTMEWRRESERQQTGIPLPDDHRDQLLQIAAELSIAPPAWL